MDKKYKILLLLLLGLVILYLIWRIFLRINNPKGNSSLGDVFFGLEKYETPKEYQILHNLAKNSTPEPLDLGIKEYKREPVPKKLYRTWCKSDPEGICGGRKADIDALNSTQKAIPDWEQIIYGDKEIDNFLEKEFGKDHKVTKAYNLINPKYGAARADLFRYLIIYKYGGLYLDMKSCVSGPIPEMPKDKDMWISEWFGQGANQHLFPETGEYQNWYIYARKGCPLLKEIIERVVHNIYKLHENPNNIINISESLFKNLGGAETKSKGNVLCTTGPIAMTIAILNSNQINNVQVDTSINNVLDYYCIKDDYIARKDHYSQQTEPLIFPKKDVNYIPKVVYMTYHDIDSIPQYVFNNIDKYCSGYEVKIYNDNMCLEFLEKYYGKEAVEIFNNMEIGAHKADFWRYCILYVFGGYYFDIKTDFQTHINNIFDSKKEKTWYTVICSDNSCLYNGIIVTPPHNPVILDAIKHIYNNPKPSDYHNYVRELLNIVNKNCRNKVKVGENEQKNGWQCILLQEKCDNCDNNCDQYGLDCIIVDKEGKKVFNTRYKDFGSWGKQKVENYVHSQKTYISMTTIPERLKDDWFLNNLKRTIGLLENNQILIINIPKVSLKGEQYIIPDVMNTIQGKNFIINHCEKDEGPISKLLPSLRNKEIKDDDIIVVCDDDIVFREDVFKLLEKSVVDTKNSFASMCTPGPEGFKGFAFIKKTLKPLLNVKIPESCQRIDDDVIKWYMNKNNMHNIVVSYKGNNDWNCSMYKEETDTHPKWSELNTDDREPMTKKCLKDLNNTKEDYSPVHITIIVTYISDNIISNKRLSALKNNINKYQNITLNVIGKKKEILKTLIEKQRASNENVIDMLNKALITNCEYIIITEDDFYPIDNFYNKLIHTVRLLPKNWRTLHLCPGKLWGRTFGEPDEPGKLRWECGTEPNIPYHKSKRFYINGEDNLFLQHKAWLGGPMCFLIQQKNIPNFMEEYKTHNFDDACDVILTKMLSSNDFICRDPLLGYEKTQGLSVFDENVKDIKEDYTPSRAQYGQDLSALEYHNHKRNGTYLEIGVHDGENANNTVMMDQEYGWCGVCIDPMMKNMENRSCKQFNVALGSEPGEADFSYGDGSFDEGDQGLSGLDKFATSDDNKKWKDTVSNFKMKKVPVRTPEDVFTEANLPSTIDYMSVDVEGAEMDILKKLPL
jgi:FkbM family methyltransferase